MYKNHQDHALYEKHCYELNEYSRTEICTLYGHKMCEEGEKSPNENCIDEKQPKAISTALMPFRFIPSATHANAEKNYYFIKWIFFGNGLAIAPLWIGLSTEHNEPVNQQILIGRKEQNLSNSLQVTIHTIFAV